MSGSAIMDYEQTMALVLDRVDDDASASSSGSFTPRVTVIRRPSASAPWAPTPPRPTSGPQPRATALPHLDEPAPAIALSPELEASFRTLCALRGLDPARALQGLVRSYVILGLAQGVKP